MPKLSSTPLKKKSMEIILNDFWRAIASLQSEKEIEDFFFDLFTHTERKMLAKRLQIAMMLLEGHSYPDIRSSLKVADHTITKISNWLKTGAAGLTKVAKRLIERKESHLIERKTSGGKYLAGDLLMPAVDAGVDLVARYVKKKQRERRRKLLLDS